MAAERTAAAKQIHRSLNAWRDRAADGESVQRKPQIPSGGGNPLPAGLKSKMEGKLGADFSDVKIHTGGDSEKASEDLNAKAFTVGNDVHFGSGQFDPSSKEGEKLVAHELTHVVQGQRGGVQRKEDDGGEEVEGADGEALEVSDPDEPAEKEADEAAEKAVEDEPAGDGEAKSVAAKLKGVSRKIFRAAAPAAAFDEAAVRAKLSSKGVGDAARAVANLKASPVGTTVVGLVLSGRFDACDGYGKVLSQLQSASQVATTLPCLQEAARLQDRGWKVEFEKHEDEPKYFDIDVAAVTGDGKIARALAVKRCENLGGLARNLNAAASQLEQASAAQKWAVVHVAAGTMLELRQRYWGGVTAFKSAHGDIRARIVMPDGTVVNP